MTLSDLRTRLVADVSAALDGRTRVAFVNYPDISNVGDAALWLGTFAVLRRLDIEFVWIGRAGDLDIEAITRSGADAILVNGGGNFGDLWPGQQEARERLLAARPVARVVQLPQSVHFGDPTNEARNIRLWSALPDAVIMWREQASHHWGAERLPGIRHILTHDAAFGIDPLETPARPVVDELWLLRQDQESLGRKRPPSRPGREVVDWAAPDRTDPKISSLRAMADDARRRGAADAQVDAYRQLAERRLARGMGLLSRGRVVVTDRLHGHVLATLAGRPNVVLDNSYGKVHGVVEQSTADLSGVHLASSSDEAAALAGDLLQPRVTGGAPAQDPRAGRRSNR